MRVVIFLPNLLSYYLRANWPSKVIEDCDDNLSAVAAFSVFGVDQLVSGGAGWLRQQ